MQLVKMIHGSHLFGTNTAQSDMDYKAVVVPDPRLILLQKAKNADHEGSTNLTKAKNTAADVDVESFSLQKFLSMAAENQTIAVEMLFAPRSAYVGAVDPVWEAILANRHLLVSRQTRSFVGYARGQAARYAVRGDRVTSMRKLLAVIDAGIEAHGTKGRLERIKTEIEALAAEDKFVSIEDRTLANSHVIPHVVCADRMMGFTTSLKDTRDTFQRALDEYGPRSLMAEQLGGADWKAMGHALRIADEAVELLTTSRLVFPRHNAAHLLKVRQGLVPLDDIVAAIADAQERILAAEATSTLPEAPDRDWIDQFVIDAYGAAVTRYMRFGK